jgi:hypothetical protein
MGTLRIGAWQQLGVGEKLPYIIRMVPLWFQIVVFLLTDRRSSPRFAKFSKSGADPPFANDHDALRTIRGKAWESCESPLLPMVGEIGEIS